MVTQDKFFNTKDKLSEATHFLGEMKKYINSEDEFRYSLSAYVTAVHSVIDFLLTDTNGIDPTMNGWRSEEIKILDEDEFRKIVYKKRKQTVHTKPLKPHKDIVVESKPLPEPLAKPAVTVFVGPTGVMFNELPQASLPIQIFRHESTPKFYFDSDKKMEVIPICEVHLKNVADLVKRCEHKYTGGQ